MKSSAGWPIFDPWDVPSWGWRMHFQDGFLSHVSGTQVLLDLCLAPHDVSSRAPSCGLGLSQHGELRAVALVIWWCTSLNKCLKRQEVDAASFCHIILVRAVTQPSRGGYPDTTSP